MSRDGSPRAGWLVGLLVLFGGLPLLGAGWSNGDQAVYLDQAARWAPLERWTHAAYVVAHLGWGTPLRSDLLTLACFAVACGLVGRAHGARAGLALVGACAPWACFGEVDGPWFSLVVAASYVRPSWAGVPTGLAVAFSPSALAAVPWLTWRQGRPALVGSCAAVACLLACSGGDWLVGRRGVLVSDWSLDPVAQLLPMALAWFALGGTASSGLLLAATPLLVAPSDVPVGLIGVLAVATEAPGRRSPRADVLLAALLGLGLSGLALRYRAVRQANADLAEAVSVLSPADAVEGSWSDRVRTSLAVTGRPEGFQGTSGRRFRVQLGQGRPITRL